MQADWLRPDWDLPVAALMTTRAGGVSVGPYASLNVSTFVGDDPIAVAENRTRVERALGVPLFLPWLVHGHAVVRIDAASLHGDRPLADACWSTDPSVACAVTAADCLPVLFSTPDGRAVAAAHAGWRGLASGVLRCTVSALTFGAGCQASELHAWMGPCIGPQKFEVGEDVLLAFGVNGQQPGQHFTPQLRADGAVRWLANLPALAHDQLHAAGVHRVSGDTPCTASDAARYFSYRRDRTTGRMVAAIACRPNP